MIGLRSWPPRYNRRVEPEDIPDWECLLAAERHLQALVPATVLVGGTAGSRFDEVLADLEAAAGWQTARVRRPVAIFGRLDGVMTGIRKLRRTQPLETEVLSGLRVPTLAEMARIKAWLLAVRHTVRDYLDTVVLLERLGETGARDAFARFDELYAQQNGASALVEVVERLASAAPSDAPEVDLRTYKGLVAPWNDWAHLAGRGRRWAGVLAQARLSGGGS